ncbi:DUF6483 family protein [Lacticaseibacillus absianus]|uniref:DUF6483 family protein n=1 Tax=Lacticaseibacillus absianus TaxID=2729623 RepID=UPI0015C9EEED|nr:DUF6483 family protein [Lacticaseibacillus absianus]
MQQREDDDWLMRQIKGFAQGLHYLLGGSGDAPETTIVWPQAEAATLPYQTELEQLIETQQFAKADALFQRVRYAMPPQDYLVLGRWFYAALARYSDATLAAGGLPQSAIQAGLHRLEAQLAE